MIITNKLKVNRVNNSILPIKRRFSYDTINSKFPNLTNINTTHFPSLFSIPVQWGHQVKIYKLFKYCLFYLFLLI